MVAESADPEAQIIFGTVIDERLQGEVKVTVIATGFTGNIDVHGTVAYEPVVRTVQERMPSYSTLRADDLDIPAFLRDRR